MKIAIIGLLLVNVAQTAMAQQLPSAGGQLRQIPPPRPPPQQVLPDLRVERAAEAAAADPAAGPQFQVTVLHIAGMTVFPESELIAATGFTSGAMVTLGQLRQMAGRITDYYAAHGYFVSQAYLPAQEVTGGSVTISVIEGHYGAVTLKNGSRVSDGTARRILSGLDTGDIVAGAPLERRLLLLSDLPGTQIRSTLSPGTAVGTSDLLVEIDRARSVTGSIDADNAGNRYTGYYRIGGSVNFNNPLGSGDVVSVSGLVTDGGLTYVRASYQAPVGAATAGVAYARLDYRLRREFSALDAHGSADVVSAFVSYPLIRSYNRNVYLIAAGNFNKFHDQIDSTGSVSDKQSTVGSLGLSGNGRDRGGSSFWSITWSIGNLDISTPVIRDIDAVTARTAGSFNKLTAVAGRIQNVTSSLSLYLAARGQLASKNLDVSEKMELGGVYGVRAYPQGEAFGDQGYIINAEARWVVARQLPGDLSLVGFIDYGAVTFNRYRYLPTPNSAHLSGVGVGVTWAQIGNFQLKASYAHRLGSAPVMSGPDASGQFWLQATKLF